MADFPSMLKYLREREDLSQRELAAKLGMSASAICMYEQGKRQPRHEDEECIADYFNVDLNTLRGRRTNEDEPLDSRTRHFVDLFLNVPDDIQKAVEILLESAQRSP